LVGDALVLTERLGRFFCGLLRRLRLLWDVLLTMLVPPPTRSMLAERAGDGGKAEEGVGME
jgi:hypothetical protein